MTNKNFKKSLALVSASMLAFTFTINTSFAEETPAETNPDTDQLGDGPVWRG